MRNLLTTVILFVCLVLAFAINPQSTLAQRTSRPEGKPPAATKTDAAGWSPSAHLRITGDVDNEIFGWPAQIVGDVNGDGYDDLAINSMGNPEGGIPGRLLVYYGGKEGLGDTPDWEIPASEWGGEEDLLIGLALAGAGDVNGDGIDDLALTALDFGEGQQGRLLVYFGDADGLAREPQRIPSPPVEQMIFGLHLWEAGDVNGDGYADLAVAGFDDPEDSFVLYVYHGGHDGLGEEPAWTLTDLVELEKNGMGFTAAGDVTGDGFDDVLVGPPTVADSAQLGQIRLYEGGPDGLGEEAVWRDRTAFGTEGLFGLLVANLGDTNGDGHSDFAVAVPTEGDKAGRVVIYLGSADSPYTWKRQQLHAELADSVFGVMVFAAGDVNGDGYADLLTGSVVEGDENVLLWQLYLGSSDGLLLQHVFETVSPNANRDDILLHKVGSGDLNNDGYADLVLSALDSDMFYRGDKTYASPVDIYWGGPVTEETDPLDRPEGVAAGLVAGSSQIIDAGESGESFGWPAQIVGDVNGDGYDDLAINSMGNPEGGMPGRLLVYYGGEDSLGDTPDWEVSASDWGGEEEVLVGLMLAGAGDVNGDGFDDLAITALDFEEGEQGRLLVYFGGADGPLREPQQIPSPPVEQLIFGLHLWAAGDVNGDGFADLAVAGLDDPENRLLLYVYHGGPDGLSEVPAWTLTDLAALEQYGVGFTAAGDVTGNGFDDVLVGSPAFPEGTERGQIRLYEGGIDGLTSEAIWTKNGLMAQGFFGLSVANLGDSNGDGYDDYAVAEPDEGGEAGRVVIYLGSADGPQEWRKEYLQIELVDGIFGMMVFAAGDVNGDGYADLLTGSIVEGREDVLLWQLFLGSSDGILPQPIFRKAFPSADPAFILLQKVGGGDLNGDGYADLVLSTLDPNTLSGGDIIEASPVHIYWGGPSAEEGGTEGSTAGLAAGSRQILDDGEPDEFFGWPALIIGDVNGDGYDDLAVNSLGNPEAQIAGRVALYLGAQTGLANQPDWQGSGANWADRGEDDLVYGGLAIGAAGDLNGDGYDDMAVTAVAFLNEIAHVLVYYGGSGGFDAASSPLTPPDMVMEELIFGIRLAAAGDVNGDGYDDLAVLALDNSDSQLHLFVYHGGADGVADAPAWSVDKLEPFQDMGAGFAGVGDVDGDGYADFVVGAPGYPQDEEHGQIRFYAGGPEGLALEPTWTQDGETPEGYFGASVAGLGDVNGDGYSDFAVTEPGYSDGSGRVVIYFGGETGPDLGARQPLAVELKDGVFGILVFGVGDVNADGYADLAVGSVDETGGNALMWQLFHGSSDGLLSTPHLNLSMSGVGEALLFLTSMGRGDLNGDGYADLAFSDVDLEALMDGGIGGGEAIVYYSGSPADEDAGQSRRIPLAGTVSQPPSAQMAVTDLEIAAENRLPEGYVYISLSPDGHYLLAVNGPILCALPTDTLLEESCVVWKPTLTSINYGNVTWSPDSRYVALTEDSVRLFYESDIWILDVAEARLRNLTDDGVDGGLLKAEGAMVDAAPAWSPDGSMLLFARSRRLEDGNWDGTALYILDVEDGSFTKIMTVADDLSQAISHTPHWLLDGTAILYSATFPKERAENGIWTVRHDGSQLQQLLTSTDKAPMPVLTDLSVATGLGLVWYPYLASAREITISPFALMDLETGKVEELIPTEYQGDGVSGPYAATFSPDGSKLLYTYRDDAGSYYLAVRDVQSGEDAVLLRGDELMGVGSNFNLALDWAANDLIFAGMMGEGGLLLELGGNE